jgi:hypothetical protein
MVYEHYYLPCSQQQHYTTILHCTTIPTSLAPTSSTTSKRDRFSRGNSPCERKRN